MVHAKVVRDKVTVSVRVLPAVSAVSMKHLAVIIGHRNRYVIEQGRCTALQSPAPVQRNRCAGKLWTTEMHSSNQQQLNCTVYI